MPPRLADGVLHALGRVLESSLSKSIVGPHQIQTVEPLSCFHVSEKNPQKTQKTLTLQNVLLG